MEFMAIPGEKTTIQASGILEEGHAIHSKITSLEKAPSVFLGMFLTKC